MGMFDNLYGVYQYRCECGAKFRWMPELRSHKRKCRLAK